MPGMPGVDSLPIIAWLTIAILTTNALVMAGVSMIHPRENGPAAWAFANMLVAVGITIMTLRTPQNEPLVALIGNMMFVVGYVGLWYGCTRFKHQAMPWVVIAIILLLHLPAFTWFLLVEPDAAIRVSIMALTLAILCTGIAWSMLRGIEPGLLQTQAFIGIIFGVLGVLYLLRATAAFTGMIVESNFSGGPLGSGIFIIPALASLLATAAYSLMLNQRLQQNLRITAQTDPLTGLLNRGLIDEIGSKEVSRAKRHGYGLSLVIFDLDYFDRINQKHGYTVGDAIMRQIAQLATSSMRHEDYLARLDGATFCIMLPSTRIGGAQQRVERLRRQLSEISLDNVRVTASFGIASLGLHADDWDSLMQRAQTALYRAKMAGRNRLEIAPLSEVAFEPPAGSGREPIL